MGPTPNAAEPQPTDRGTEPPPTQIAARRRPLGGAGSVRRSHFGKLNPWTKDRDANDFPAELTFAERMATLVLSGAPQRMPRRVRATRHRVGMRGRRWLTAIGEKREHRRGHPAVPRRDGSGAEVQLATEAARRGRSWGRHHGHRVAVPETGWYARFRGRRGISDPVSAEDFWHLDGDRAWRTGLTIRKR